MDEYASLRLERQLCFPLYAAAKEVVRLYTPHLQPLGLTYTQYIVMMVVWAEREVAVKALGRRLYLDTGTLTPLLRKLAARGLVRLDAQPGDRRSVRVTATEAGMTLREAARDIPARVGACVPLDADEAQALYRLTHKILGAMTEREDLDGYNDAEDPL